VNAQTPEADYLRYAADFLARGEVVAIPTDTVYGLAADPFNLAAVDEIYRVKGRPEARARHFLRLAHKFWPGALTLVVEAASRVPLKVTANTGRVALRWPKNAIVEQLIEEFDGPVTGTSANVSGFPSCASAAQVMKQLGTRLPLVLDGGESGATLASTIVELNGDSWRIGREGAISVAEIERALK